MTRRILGGVGVLLAGYGLFLLATDVPARLWAAVATWLAGGVVVHDFVLAPLVIAASWAGSRLLPAWARGPVAIGGLILGTLTVVAVPVLGGWGRRPDNPTLLDRDYVLGWSMLAGLTLIGVTGAALAVRSIRRRGGENGERAGRRRRPDRA